MRAKKIGILCGLTALIVSAGVYWRKQPAVPAADGGIVTKPGAAAVVPRPSEPTPAPSAPPAAAANVATRPAPFLRWIERPSAAAQWEVGNQAPTRHVHYVQIDPGMAEGKDSPFWTTGGGGRFGVTLPDGRQLTVKLGTTQVHGAHRFVATGDVEGQGYSRVVLAYNEGEISGVIEDMEHGAWQLRPVGDGVAQFYQLDAAQLPGCGLDSEVMNPAKMQLLERRALAAQALQGDATVPPASTLAAEPDGVELRILLVYTNAVARLNGANARQATFDAAIAGLNSDFARSGIPISATLAGSMQVSYPDDEGTDALEKLQSNALTRLSDPLDGQMDEIHARRDQLAADVVCLVHNRADKTSGGIAYLLEDPGQVHNPTRGFSVVQYSLLNVDNTFSHEIGHNLGCAHDREHSKDVDGKETEGAYSYSYGYRFEGEDNVQYRTIMSYDPGKRLAYFSSPDITAPAPINRPVGIREGQPREADNARTIRNLGFEVAGYRFSQQQPVNPGRLINVSTRAFVGADAQQLIGGFSVRGSEPKRLLIRAIGPSLTQFGVAGALSDPVLRIVRIGDSEIVAANDNWADDVRDEMTAAGAFQLPNGSRDAVVVSVLQDGNYTANIEGVNGSTGVGLVEAYELDRGATRFVNLSTRGYATQDRPMIGGFVIAADPAHPGKTKRIVIRVMGPSLANFGVAGAMEDPMFTLHDANGTQLLQNDDWSSGNTGGDDFKPAVTLYAEQAIAAAGLALGNRRDSGAMVDLLPGLYTAIVKPFQELPDQVEEPGVALVEVYEIIP